MLTFQCESPLGSSPSHLQPCRAPAIFGWVRIVESPLDGLCLIFRLLCSVGPGLLFCDESGSVLVQDSQIRLQPEDLFLKHDLVLLIRKLGHRTPFRSEPTTGLLRRVFRPGPPVRCQLTASPEKREDDRAWEDTPGPAQQ